MLLTLGLNTRAPYHLFIYSIAFGGASFYSFIASPIAIKVLEKDQFGKLQNKVFPLYFLGQTLAPILLAATTPINLCPFTSSLLVLSSIASAVNFCYLLPKCRDLKEDKLELIAKQLDVIDGVETEEFKNVKKLFGRHHGISMLANLISIATLGVYGMVLSKRLIR